MKQVQAWRKDGNGYKEVMVNIDPVNNIPLLPPNTTTDPKPEEHNNMFLTVRDNYWIYLPKNPVESEVPIDTLAVTRGVLKANYDKWKDAYVDAPFYHDGFVLHNDLIARTNILGAFVAFKFHDRMPPKWKAMGGKYLNPTPKWLDAISLLSVHYYESRLFTAEMTNYQIAKAETVEELQRIVFPVIPHYEGLLITGPAEDEALRPLYDHPPVAAPIPATPLEPSKPVGKEEEEEEVVEEVIETEVPTEGVEVPIEEGEVEEEVIEDDAPLDDTGSLEESVEGDDVPFEDTVPSEDETNEEAPKEELKEE